MGSGYSNLVQHVQCAHPNDYVKIIDDIKKTVETPSASSNADSFFFPKKTIRLYGWLDLVINGMLPFSTVTNPVFGRNVKFESISRNTLKKYLSLLTREVEAKIRSALPQKFCLVFDGWSHLQTHFLGVYATFPSRSPTGYSKILLGFSPFESEQSTNADAHIDYFEFVLKLFDKEFSNVTAIVGDNCSVNHSIATKIGHVSNTGFIGCASHRYNLALKNLITKHASEVSVEKVRNLMKSLRKPKMAGKLREVSHLRAVTDCPTRWSSTVEMLRRYSELRDILENIDDDELEKLLLNGRENRQIEKLCGMLFKLDSVTKALQNDGTSCADVRILFDEVIKDFPETSARLSSSAKIVHQQEFESAIVKLQDKKMELLTTEEKKSIEHLKCKDSEIITENNSVDSLSYAEQALKKRKINHEKAGSCYMDTRYIVPTSNMCERLFSKTGYALSDRRGNILPSNFEEQIFLHANSSFWNVEDVNKIAHGTNNLNDS